MTIQETMRERVSAAINQLFDIDLAEISVEVPPRTELGDLAFPVAFELAKRLKASTGQKQNPREIATRLAEDIRSIEGISRVDVAGAGYVNVYLDRAAYLMNAVREPEPITPQLGGKIIVEHTSVNPNKAAHIGHLRNAVLGDTTVRMLRAAGETVEVQNYIDNTGVQVADVVVGFKYIENKTLDQIKAMEFKDADYSKDWIAQPGGRSRWMPSWIRHKFDYYCWDLYARVGQFYEEDKSRLQLRTDTLHELEKGEGETYELADYISQRVLGCHLETMLRVDIKYDVLPRESDVLHLHIWQKAFDLLKERGAVEFEKQGRLAGCWVMRSEDEGPAEEPTVDPLAIVGTGEPASNPRGGGNDSSQDEHFKVDQRLEPDEHFKVGERLERDAHFKVDERLEREEHAEEDERASEKTSKHDADKVIVRSNGTVTYTGKDIAFHLWKLGQLDIDFYYKPCHTYADGHVAWVTTTDPKENDPAHPQFGSGAAYFNVIDIGQSYPQHYVKLGVMAVDHDQRVERSAHLAYEKVALTPATVEQLGQRLSEEDRQRGAIGMSGRKGLGVKIDDLIDVLEANALVEVANRHPELTDSEQNETAHKIAVGALRYFLLKFTRNSIISFDFKEALAFDGETGPYIQYSVVRANSIFRKLADAGIDASAANLNGVSRERIGELFAGEGGDDLWSLVYLAARLEDTLRSAVAAHEPAIIAKWAFQIAQRFNLFYHNYHILSEPDPARRALLVAITSIARRQLIAALGVLGIEAPERM